MVVTADRAQPKRSSPRLWAMTLAGLVAFGLPAAAQVTTIETGNSAGRSNAAASGSDGLPIIAYEAYNPATGNAELKIAHCENPACTTWTVTVLYPIWTSSLDHEIDIAIGGDGLPLIAFSEFTAPGTPGSLKVVHCNDSRCNTSSTTTVVANRVGYYPVSLVTGADGLGFLTFVESTAVNAPQIFKAVHCDDAACTATRSADIDVLDHFPSASVTIGVDGLPLISYAVGGTIRAVHCTDTVCTNPAPIVLTDGATATSSALAADGRVTIVISRGPLTAAHCTDVVCTSVSLSAIDTAGQYGRATTAGDGAVLVSYRQGVSSPFRTTIARCSDAACSSSTRTFIENNDEQSERFRDMTTGGDGHGFVSYHHYGANALKGAHCLDVTCSNVRLTVGDATLDGRADVLLRRNDGDITMLVSTGTSFTPASWASGLTDAAFDVYLADATGDGRADLISRNKATGDVEVFRSIGTAFVYTPGTGPGGVWSFGWGTSYDLRFADVTGDNRADLVGRHRLTGDVNVLPSTGNGFDSVSGGLWSFGWTDGYDVYLADVTGDGRADLITRYYGPILAQTGDVYVSISTGTSFQLNGRWTYGYSSGYDLYFADANGDGRADLVGRHLGTTPGITGDVYVMRSIGSSFSWFGQAYRWSYGWGAAYDLVVRDFDGDGKSDLAGRLRLNSEVYVAPSTGTRFVFVGAWATGVDTSYELR